MDTPSKAPPKHLSRAMKAFWREITHEYELGADAALTLQVACENWDRACAARVLIDREGLVMDGKKHPAADIEKVAYGMFLRAMRALGLDIIAPGPMGRPPGR